MTARRLLALLLLPCLLSAGVVSADEMAEGWQAWGFEGSVGATAYNEDGNAFTLTCPVKRDICYFYFEAALDCQDGTTSTALLSTETGLAPFALYCKHSGGHPQHILPDPKAAEVLAGADNLGIAISTGPGRFATLRFPVTGFEAALKDAQARRAAARP